MPRASQKFLCHGVESFGSVAVSLDATNPGATVEIHSRYHVTKNEVARALAKLASEKLPTKLRAAGRKVPPKLPEVQPIKMMRRACAVMRELRDVHGIVLKIGGHSLQRRNVCPQDEPPESFMELWRKDHVFRGLCVMHVAQCPSWTEMLLRVKDAQRNLQSRLVKPFRRMLAQKKISVTAAYVLQRKQKAIQLEMLRQRKWTLSSKAMIEKMVILHHCKEEIRLAGRKPASDVTNPTRKQMIINHKEAVPAMRAFRMAGGVVPTSQRGINKLVKDLHDRKSPAYKLVNRPRAMDVWTVNMPLPPIPVLENVSVRLFKTQEDWTNEGREMSHCVGMYAGKKGLFAHLERGTDKATLWVSPDGAFQCYGPCNQPNPLSRDIVDQAVPVLKEWLTEDKLSLVKPEPIAIPELAAYD